jgi:phosphatidylserine/phosphatidylglycerophosphate/cardiolipin synthase-like enzyme
MIAAFRVRTAAFCAAFLFLFAGITSAQCVVQTYFSPYDNIEGIVINRLSGAQHSVHCSLYGITNVKITNTLKTLLDQSVEVKLCLDKTQSAGKHDTHQQLADDGAEVVIKKSGVLEHNKFCVIDNAMVMMGSWNYSNSAQKQDNSMVVLSGCDEIVKQFEAAFQRIHERDR